MRNKILFGIVAISIGLNIFLLMGCDVSEAFGGDRLQPIDNSWTTVQGKVVIDRQTGVEYWYISGGNSSASTLTLLVDQDGKPLIYKGE